MSFNCFTQFPEHADSADISTVAGFYPVYSGILPV